MYKYTVNKPISFGAKIGNIPNIKKIAGKRIPLSDVKLDGYNAFIGADVYMPSGEIKQHDLLFRDDELVAIDDFCESKIKGLVNYVLLKGKMIAPAIFDEHIHGGFGVSFHNSTEAEIRKLLKQFNNEGIGGVLATMLPDSVENIKNQIKILNNIIKNPDKNATKIFGIHLEGPFLNPQKAGIHPRDILKLPTIETYEKFEPENVKMVTLAPELDEDYKLSKYLFENGVIASAGHSMASAKNIIDSGIKQVTHIFNAMAGFHHRNETMLNEALMNDKITAEMIADVTELTPKTMQLVMKLKPKEKLVLVSDALPNAEKLEDFVMNNIRIIVKNDYTATSDAGVIAGNMRILPDSAKEIIEKTGMEFADFITYSSKNPTRNVGVQDKFELKEGAKPIFSVWDEKNIFCEKTFTN